MPAQRFPEIIERPHRHCIADPVQTDTPHHRQRRVCLVTAHKWLIQHIVDAPRLCAKAAIIRRCLGSGEIANGFLAAEGIGEQIKALCVIPSMASDHLGLANFDKVIETRTAGVEYLVEYVAHGEHGRPGLDWLAVYLHGAGFPANFGFFFDYGDAVTARSEHRGAG